MGAPYFQIKQLARRGNVAVFSSNFVLYGDMSRRIASLLKKYVPTEIYSVDESFLDMSGIDESKLDALGHKIARTVKQYRHCADKDPCEDRIQALQAVSQVERVLFYAQATRY